MPEILPERSRFDRYGTRQGLEEVPQNSDCRECGVISRWLVMLHLITQGTWEKRIWAPYTAVSTSEAAENFSIMIKVGDGGEGSAPLMTHEP